MRQHLPGGDAVIVYHAGGADYARTGYSKPRLGTHTERLTPRGVERSKVGVLVAYDGRGETTRDTIAGLVGAERRVLLDSGAFVAWRTGQARDLRRYVEVCRALSPLVDAYASLDVIGDHAATLANHVAMLDAGLDPVPTYHCGEPEEALMSILALGPRYIGLGGLVGRSRGERQAWLDRTWSLMVHHAHWPFRVHGWGVTDTDLMPRYPWFSVDSSSAVSKALSGYVGPIASRAGIQTSHAPGKHALVRIRLAMDAIEELASYATDKWAARGIVWSEEESKK